MKKTLGIFIVCLFIGLGSSSVSGGFNTGNADIDLAGLNRDIDNVQEITKDEITGALDGSATIDNRVLTESGRDQIADQHENFVDNLETAIKDASVAPIAIGGIGYGAAGMIVGGLSGNDTQIIVGENGNLHFVGSYFGADGTAVNLGGAISYFGDSHPDNISRPYYSPYNVVLGHHEESHTDQWRDMSSPVFLYEWIKGGGPSINNPIENHSPGGANDRAKDRMQNEGIFDKMQQQSSPRWENGQIQFDKAGIYK